MVANFLTSQMHLKLELMHNETGRTSRLEIAVKTLMILSSSLIKVDHIREKLPHSIFCNKMALKLRAIYLLLTLELLLNETCKTSMLEIAAKVSMNLSRSSIKVENIR